jgi:hypothetical protein
MSQEEPPVSRHLQQDRQDSYEGAAQKGMLGCRLSKGEIQSLLVLRLRWQQAPDACDLPADEPRLQFARWLVEHGKLSEGEGSRAHEPVCSGADVSPDSPREHEPVCVKDIPSELEGCSTDERPQDQSQQSLCTVGMRIRQSLARIGAVGRKVATWLFVPSEPWDRSYGLYGPYPHVSPWSCMEDPLFWRHFGSGW